jgi:hypothetical protein
LHPQAQRHRALMLEDGVCYFHPEISFYDQTRLKPQVAQMCRETDWLREANLHQPCCAGSNQR